MMGRISLAPLSTLISEAEAVFCLCAEVWNSTVVGTNTALATATINTRRNEDLGAPFKQGLAERAHILAQKCWEASFRHPLLRFLVSVLLGVSAHSPCL